MLRRIFNAAAYFLSGFSPRNPRKVLLGAWMGQRYADNPKYLMLHLAAHHPELDLVWCGRGHVRRELPADVRVRFVEHGSAAAFKECLTAGACFVSHGYRDVSPVNLFRGAALTYLGHGFAIKRMGGGDRPLRSRLLSILRGVLRHAEGFRYYVASSTEHRRKLLTEYTAQNITADAVLDIGQPRVDYLLSPGSNGLAGRIRERLLEGHALPARRVVTYLPTFRDSGTPVFAFSALDSNQRLRLEALLRKHDAVLIEKGHPGDSAGVRGGQSARAADDASRVVRIESTRMDTQELLLATDLLITDYSGCYLDFLVLDRPVIHFAYDYAEYARSERGLFFELPAIAAGPIVGEFDRLLDTLDASLSEPAFERRRRHDARSMLMEFERGGSGAAISSRVLGLETEYPAPEGALAGAIRS